MPQLPRIRRSARPTEEAYASGLDHVRSGSWRDLPDGWQAVGPALKADVRRANNCSSDDAASDICNWDDTAKACSLRRGGSCRG